MNFGIDRSMQQQPTQIAPSVMTLTDRELLKEAEDLARRIAHSQKVNMRDVRIVQALAARLRGPA